MGIRESLLNTITSVGNGDFVRVVTSAGASSKATLQNVIKSFETGLGSKSSLTTSDYIRVVGSDNNLYKQSVSAVKTAMGVDNKIGSSPTGTAGKLTDLLLSRDSIGYYISIWSTDDPSTRRGILRLDPDEKKAVTVTASANVVIDTNKSYKCGNTLFLNVKGHTTAALSNTSVFVFAGATVNPNSFTFGIPVGPNAWDVNGMSYGYINSNGVVGRIASGQYFHIAQAFLCDL